MQWNLIKLRKENDLTQDDLADILNMSVSTYRNKETGKSSFRDYEMFILRKHFDKSLEEIFLPRHCSDNAIIRKTN